MANILIVDDDVMFCNAMAAVLGDIGHSSTAVTTMAEGVKRVEEGGYDLVILDVGLPDGNGLDAIPAIRESRDHPEVIILTGSGDPDGAEMAIRSGAWDYITKPPTMNKIRLPVTRAVEYQRKKASHRPRKLLKREHIVGDSRAMRSCLEEVARAAESGSNVLITGETGTGKELVARAIHDNSARSKGPFIVVDCASLPENLVESMLFGHEKGAFTTAERRSEGLVLQAHKGTLFLDEVGELPMTVQKSFLRVLQEHRFRPVGGAQEVTSDFRLVAATNRDLDAMVELWQFRQDLLYRVRAVTIDLPPLRDRTGDVESLCRHFLDRHSRKTGTPMKKVSPELWGALLEYDWPGNVRELFNALESAVAAAGSEPMLFPSHLPVRIRASIVRSSVAESLKEAEPAQPTFAPDPDDFPTLKDHRATVLAEVERQYLEELLRITDSNVKRACELSGLSRARLYALMKQHGVSR